MSLLQARLSLFPEPGALNQRTVAGRNQEVDAQVDPDALPGLRERFSGDIGALDAHPVALAFPPDGDRLGGPFDRAVQTHFHVPYPVQAEPLRVLIEGPAIPIAPLERDKGARSFEPWEPRLLLGLASSEEPLEGPVESLERSPTNRYPEGQGVGADRAKLGELLGLVEKGDRMLVPLPGTAAFFKSGVVELSLEFA